MKLLNYQPHPKIKYSAGMISLVLLPLFCLGWLYYNKAFERKSFIDIAFYSPEWNRNFSNKLQFEFPPKRDYTVINLEGNNNYDRISLQYAHILLNQWKIAKDTIQGIDFHFGRKAKYWTFVEAVNICKSVGLDSYMPYKNNMYAAWYFHPKPVEQIVPIFICGTMNNNISTKTPTDWLAVFQIYIKDYWAPGIVFLLMAILTFQQLLRRPNSSVW